MPTHGFSLLLLLLISLHFSLLHSSSLPALPDPSPVQPLATPAATIIPAFPEQSDVSSPSSATCPLSLPSDLVRSLSYSCSPRRPFSSCCPALAASLYSAFAPTALSLPASSRAAKSLPLPDLPDLPDDSESCAGQVERALGAKGVDLPRVNATCDVAYCYCGIRLRRLSCAGSGSFVVGEKEGRWEPTPEVGRRLQWECRRPGVAGCGHCLRALNQLSNNGSRSSVISGSNNRERDGGRECQLMGLTWLLAKNRTHYLHTATSVLRAIMAADPADHGGAGPTSCSVEMPFAVGSDEFYGGGSAAGSSGSEISLKSSPLTSPNYNFMRSSAAIPSMVYQHPYAWDYQYDYPMGSPPRDPAVEITPSPPPPAAEGGSAWDFFDPFNSYEQYVQQDMYYGMGSGSSSTDLSEVREREGIPALEEETDTENLRTARKGKRVMDVQTKRKDFGEGTSKSMTEDEKGVEEDKGNTIIIENSADGRSEIKEKEVIYEEESGPSNVNSATARGTRDLLVAVKEIKELFNLAATCGEEISRMLEVGKLNYRSSSRFLRVFSSRILEPMWLCMLKQSLPFKHSQPSATRAMKNRGNATVFKNRSGMKSLNLSSTLEKLYMWEKKLYKEVKVVMVG